MQKTSTQEQIAELLKKSQKTVVLTGAGISTASGLPDYRSASGLWSKQEQMKLATEQALKNRPEDFWKFYWHRIEGVLQHGPNQGHSVLAELEKAGYIQHVITQNVDDYHTQAGSQNLVYLHGNITSISNSYNRNKKFSTKKAQQLASLNADGVPRDPLTGDVLRPDVVFFGERLPKANLHLADALAGQADVLLVIGTSLNVPPASSLPLITLQNGGKIIIINKGTTYIDQYAEILCEDDITESLLTIKNLLLTNKMKES